MESQHTVIKPRKFRELPDDKKKQMIQKAKQTNPDGIIVIVEAHPLCKMFHELPEFKYIVAKKDSIREIDTKIKKRIGEADKKLANQSVFLFTEKKVVNRDTSFEQLYSKHKNFKDGVLYLYFANVDGF